MRNYFLIPLIAFAVAVTGCSKDSDPAPKIEHTVKVKFVDDNGNSVLNNQNFNDNIKVVTYDSDGVEHDFHNGDWFAIHGFTVNRYQDYIITLYLTLPEDGNDITETYVRVFNREPEVFTAYYEIREGNNPDEPYGGGTVKVKQVKYNGKVIWERGVKYELEYAPIPTEVPKEEEE